MGNIFLRFLLSYSNACTISIKDIIVVPSELLVAKIKWIILHLNLLHLKFIVYWNIFHIWKRRLCPAQVRMFEHDWIIALGEWYKHSIIFFITDGNKVSSFYTLTKKLLFRWITLFGPGVTLFYLVASLHARCVNVISLLCTLVTYIHPIYMTIGH
jgi:hypothetical protein